VVSRILADLGDRVRRVRSWSSSIARSSSTTSISRRPRWRVAGTVRRAEPGKLPPIEQTPDVKRAAAELNQAVRTSSAPASSTSVSSCRAGARRCRPRCEPSRPATTWRFRREEHGGDVDAANAAAKLAERQLRDASIRAPFDGHVQRRIVSLGELVKAQMPVMSIVRIDPLKVTAEIPEGLAPWVQAGQPVELQVDAYPDRMFTGKVSRISPAVNAQTRAFPFEALVPNGERLLKPGTFVKVKLTTDHVEPMLTLPYAALQYRYGVNRAFVIEGDHVVGKEVKLGDRLGDRVENPGRCRRGRYGRDDRRGQSRRRDEGLVEEPR
jgi:multidrug efflux pump subunit AcrA (membrane-fusion protein)